MKISTTIHHFVIASFVCILLTQCYPAKMSLQPDAWSQKEEFEVKGKNGLFSKEKLQFGEFYTTQVKRSWTNIQPEPGLQFYIFNCHYSVAVNRAVNMGVQFVCSRGRLINKLAR